LLSVANKIEGRGIFGRRGIVDERAMKGGNILLPVKIIFLLPSAVQLLADLIIMHLTLFCFQY
jgi:hypothetical protein